MHLHSQSGWASLQGALAPCICSSMKCLSSSNTFLLGCSAFSLIIVFNPFFNSNALLRICIKNSFFQFVVIFSLYGTVINKSTLNLFSQIMFSFPVNTCQWHIKKTPIPQTVMFSNMNCNILVWTCKFLIHPELAFLYDMRYI